MNRSKARTAVGSAGIAVLAVVGLTFVLPDIGFGSGRQESSEKEKSGSRNHALMAEAIDVEARFEAIQQRADLRAYAGAPPVIPHEIEQRDSDTECLTCHADEAGAENPKIPHKHMASCTQCHVLQENELFVEADGAENTFRGLKEPPGGTRAWQGAPPTIPHSTLMRDRCQSCHGPNDHAGLRSSHPERLSCRQCHAPDAALNQRQADHALTEGK